VKLGTNEPKKVAAVVGLFVVAGAVWFINRSSDEPPASASSTKAPTAARPSAMAARNAELANAVETPRASVSRTGRASSGSQEFRPTLKPRDPNERVDPASIDPTLQLDRLAKLQTVTLEGGQRSLFDFSSAPPPPKPKTPEPKIDFDKVRKLAEGPAAPSGPPAPPPKPPPTPIPLKFYGFTDPKRAGLKRAFFLDGEDIVVATEGDIIKKRYKVIRIGLSSAVVEDTEQKDQQTLPLVAELNG
jgi:hypothetical protein